MQILPDEKSSRWVALGLLLVLLIIGYFFLVQPWLDKHASLSEQIHAAEETLARSQAVAAQAPEVRERLRAVQDAQRDAAFFLEDSQYSLAAAWLQNEVDTLVTESVQPNETCQVANRQSVQVRDYERFEPVQINVRLMCGPDTLRELLYRIETNVPYLFIDRTAITQISSRLSRARRRGRNPVVEQQAPPLNVQFSVSGYIRPQAGGGNS
jgi:flagellar basal body-associated protein FliL